MLRRARKDAAREMNGLNATRDADAAGGRALRESMSSSRRRGRAWSSRLERRRGRSRRFPCKWSLAIACRRIFWVLDR